ncbi:hypothetical protein NHG32_07010 [Aerococcaceae bacterium NML191219]|nr:hypothetical protein [Aerococcaceae bacterium NML191219]
MQKNRKFVVLVCERNGAFVTEYKSDHSFNVAVARSTDIDKALKLPYEGYLKHKKRVKHLARALGSKIVVVEAEYKMTYPSGEPMKPFVKPKNDDYKDKALLKVMSSLAALSSIESLSSIETLNKI